MLINRFAAVAIALIIAPTASKTYVPQARRYVDFRQMDMKARRICIRGLMYLACILRHFQLPLDEALDWLGSMADTLVEEFGRLQSTMEQDAQVLKERVALCIHILLGSIRCVIETSTMDKAATPHVYPDPRLISGCKCIDIWPVILTYSLQHGLRRYLQQQPSYWPSPLRDRSLFV
jgi:hypothetical protein